MEFGNLTAAPLLEVEGVSKHYPGVLALDNVSFSLLPGEVHVLFGENGAGKSTLISLISGAIHPTSGMIRMRGEPVHFASVNEARSRGVTTVFQEFSLIPTMTVEENICLGSEAVRRGMIDRRAIRSEVQSVLARLGFDLPPHALVATLSRAEQQMVEIARAFRGDLSVLILDEPTASLTDKEAERLFDLVAHAKAHGVGIIYITHRLREIERLADRITVLREGKNISTVPAHGISEDRLVKLMSGREMGAVFPAVTHRPAEPLFRAEGLTTRSGSVRSASIEVRAGEIVGLAGLVGSGKSELIRAAFGIEPLTAGRVTLNGQEITGARPQKLLDAGLIYLPPDRRAEGLAMMRPCRENLSLPALRQSPYRRGAFIDRRAERRETNRLLTEMELYPMRPDSDVEAFSGGNQQKVMLGRSLTRPFLVYAFDEPTVGVDVGTRAAIYRFIAGLCESGAAVILISSDLPEILHLCNRAYVFAKGQVTAEVPADQLDEPTILKHFFERENAA
ncbi:monosaccharide ABC transporter ATP-binding protein, CUT2 family [Roseovarius pacificus]|uniref:Monosaccharide ABC transporter ATP-binding protein, CUT2 family n=1 Tax=Roseovarius pacificus TaxID=337701 RepID=A0A1M7KP70_9RHOB|nr:sugar ABC transporter ATP-binding protein [Roseovarius pacificus]GGO62840.1 sugar ABC transporter ATP-binding protein [Roseovarius pacificus]SHM67238.1 monosaccharide ABC transporter ATP-binding protein, CUT2 family [Roseovarius pacificus]